MTSPPENIHILCPQCGHLYEDWYRASLNLEIDDFDEEYIKEATTSTCPECKYVVDHDVLLVRPDGVWEINSSDKKPIL